MVLFPDEMKPELEIEHVVDPPEATIPDLTQPPNQARHIATFEAYIPNIKSAILIGPDGAQLKLEIPGTSLQAALDLAREGQAKILYVSIFEAPDQ